ncbi:MAG: phospholipase D-like domain-containing protein [Pseudomonadota bacterium]
MDRKIAFFAFISLLALLLSFNVSATVPLDGDVCFSPQEKCDQMLTEFILSAKKSIDVAIYGLTLYPVVNALISQSKKIPVRVVVDRLQSEGQGSGVKFLIESGVKVRFGNQNGLMHNKFTIIDGEILETGSFNYTGNAVKNNQENQVYLGSPHIVSRFSENFQAAWDNAEEK